MMQNLVTWRIDGPVLVVTLPRHFTPPELQSESLSLTGSMSGMHLLLKAINNELERLGSTAVLVKGDGYFYFSGGEATDWLDCTVQVPTLHSLTLARSSTSNRPAEIPAFA
jgi:hypothetical protein